jgi:hypothetical protein
MLQEGYRAREEKVHYPHSTVQQIKWRSITLPPTATSVLLHCEHFGDCEIRGGKNKQLDSQGEVEAGTPGFSWEVREQDGAEFREAGGTASLWRMPPRNKPRLCLTPV